VSITFPTIATTIAVSFAPRSWPGVHALLVIASTRNFEGAHGGAAGLLAMGYWLSARASRLFNGSNWLPTSPEGPVGLPRTFLNCGWLRHSDTGLSIAE